MKLPFLPRFSSPKTLFQYPLALLGGLLLCVIPVGAQAQSVTFTGTQTTLPASVLFPLGVAVDSTGDVFITDETNDGRAVELPRTATGYGPQAILPASGQLDQGVAVDSAGDVFITEATFPPLVLELPRTATGYGPQATLPASGFGLDGPEGVAVDSAGNVFITDSSNNRVVELPRTATGYGPQATLPFSGLNGPHGVAVDNGGNVFITDFTDDGSVVELPRTATGYGPQATLPFSGLNGPHGVAVDTAGNIFIVDESNNRVVELPRTATGYGQQTTLPASGLSQPVGVAVDSVGDIFITDEGNNRVVDLQTHSVNFEGVNVCASGQTTPAPCSNTLTLNFNINADVTLGTTPQVLTGGAPNLDFTLASGSTCAGAFSAGATCTVNVTFTPMAVGTRNGSVEITDGSGNVITTTLISGYGAPPIMAQFSPNPLDFGTIPFGSTSTLPLTVTNIGQTSFTLTPLINGPSYKITGSTCGAGIAAGNSCALQVEFTPYVVGTHNDTLTLQTNGLTNPTVALDGLATGIGSELEVPLEFGTILFGTTKILLLPITNVGLPGRVTFTAATSTNNYKVLTTEHQQNTCLVGIVAGQRCPLPVEFDPVNVGIHNDILTLTPSSGAAPQVISLSGTAQGPAPQVSTTLLEFNTIAFGSTETQSLMVSNIGAGTLTVSPSINGPSYKIMSSTCAAGVTAGNSCTLQVEFIPYVVGTHQDKLTLQTNGATNPTVNLQGWASGIGAELEVPLQFGSIPFGTTKTLLLTITNVALPGRVTFTAATSTNSFKVLTTEHQQNTCLVGIVAGQRCTLPIEFDPASVGLHNDVLTIIPSAGAPSTVSLQGFAD